MFEDRNPELKNLDKKDTSQEYLTCPRINRILLPSKIFFFFYFSSWGSLLPYLALYFKEMCLSPSQVGVLMGLRPFVNFIFIPLWGLLVDRFHKGKLVLLIAVIASIFTTFSLSLVSTRKTICSEVHSELFNNSRRTLLNNTVSFMSLVHLRNYSENRSNFTLRSYTFYPTSISGQPWSLAFLNEEEYSQKSETTHLFFRLFFILLFGNIMASPSLALVDAVTMGNLGEQSYKYGTQRLWGSFGFGFAAFLVGACVSTTHYCPNSTTKSSEIDYSFCFYAFVTFMFFALLSATKLDFTSISLSNEDEKKLVFGEEKSETKSANKLGTFKEQLYSLKEAMSLKFVLFLYTAFFFGFMAAFIKTFLFWHLKDLGGTEELFCIVAALHCIAEVTIYFLSARLITIIGHIRVLYLGFFCYFLRCFTYVFISNPWVVLPVELLAGITSAAVWSAMLSYVSLKSNDSNATTIQGVLHGIHWGLGNGAGEMIGGLTVSLIGTANSFLALGVVSLALLFVYSASNNTSYLIRKLKTRQTK